jgi:hypothetical protein
MLPKISDRQLGIFGAMIGVAGVLLSIYLYIITQKERQPIFLLDNESRAVIVSNNKTSESSLVVKRRDGKLINADVNIAKFYFWNNGEIPIKQENILKKILISIDGESEILSYKILDSTRGIVGESLKPNDSRSLSLSFKILERGDGISGQVIYSGNKDASIKTSGIIEGVGEIKYCSCIAPNFRNELYWIFASYASIFSVLFLLTIYMFNQVNKQI